MNSKLELLYETSVGFASPIVRLETRVPRPLKLRLDGVELGLSTHA